MPRERADRRCCLPRGRALLRVRRDAGRIVRRDRSVQRRGLGLFAPSRISYRLPVRSELRRVPSDVPGRPVRRRLRRDGHVPVPRRLLRLRLGAAAGGHSAGDAMALRSRARVCRRAAAPRRELLGAGHDVHVSFLRGSDVHRARGLAAVGAGLWWVAAACPAPTRHVAVRHSCDDNVRARGSPALRDGALDLLHAHAEGRASPRTQRSCGRAG
jgi:hypothetical protein